MIILEVPYNQGTSEITEVLLKKFQQTLANISVDIEVWETALIFLREIL